MDINYPKYFIFGKEVTKEQYIKAAASDPTLPPYQDQDNDPSRKFPDEILAQLTSK